VETVVKKVIHKGVIESEPTWRWDGAAAGIRSAR
jgi:hypothetical protein